MQHLHNSKSFQFYITGAHMHKTNMIWEETFEREYVLLFMSVVKMVKV